MASSSVPPATVPAATAAPGPGFGFASKTKKKHFVQQKVKVFRAADPLVGVFLWGVAHSVRPGTSTPRSPIRTPLLLLLRASLFPGSRLRSPSRCHFSPAAVLVPGHQTPGVPRRIFSL